MFMNAKKMSDSRLKKNIFSRAADFFGSIKQEFVKVSWVNKKDLINYTKVILVSTFTISFMIYIVDLCIQRGLGIVQFLTQWMFG